MLFSRIWEYPKRVLLRRHPKGGKMIWLNESFWARVSIKNDGQRFGEPICPKRPVTFFSYFNLSRGGTCRTEGSENSYLFLFIIFNPWTDFDMTQVTTSRGPSNAAGLRFYYDAKSRPSRFGLEIGRVSGFHPSRGIRGPGL